MKIDEERRGLYASTAPEMKDWSRDESDLFFETCERAGLDPFVRQIYPMLRVDKKDGTRRVSAGVTIDGFRIIAARSHKYRGQVGPFWCGPDGEWKDVWIDDTTPPVAAKVGIIHADFADTLWSVARFQDYAQRKYGGELNHMWATMGPSQIAKCAEALGLRRAFPELLSGLYTSDEMAQASNPEPADRPTFDPNKTKAAKSPMDRVTEAAAKANIDLKVGSKVEKPETYGAERAQKVHAFLDEKDIDLSMVAERLVNDAGVDPEMVKEDIADWPYSLNPKVRNAIKAILADAERDAEPEPEPEPVEEDFNFNASEE